MCVLSHIPSLYETVFNAIRCDLFILDDIMESRSVPIHVARFQPLHNSCTVGCFRVVCVRSTVGCSVTQRIPEFFLQCFSIHHVTTVVDAPEIPLSLFVHTPGIPPKFHNRPSRGNTIVDSKEPFCVELFNKDCKVIGFGSFLYKALSKRL